MSITVVKLRAQDIKENDIVLYNGHWHRVKGVYPRNPGVQLTDGLGNDCWFMDLDLVEVQETID